jgi:hypothetical protein
MWKRWDARECVGNTRSNEVILLGFREQGLFSGLSFGSYLPTSKIPVLFWTNVQEAPVIVSRNLARISVVLF